MTQRAAPHTPDMRIRPAEKCDLPSVIGLGERTTGLKKPALSKMLHCSITPDLSG